MTTSHGVPVVGSEERRLYLTELEAAYASDARRYGVARNTALDEAEKLRALIAKFRKAIERKVQRSNRLGSVWEPTLDECKSLASITTAAERAVAMEERLRKMIAEERKDYTPEQLEAVWQHNLRTSAGTMAARDWWDLLRIGFGADVARVLIRLRFGEDALASVEGS